MSAIWYALMLAPALLVAWLTWGFHLDVPFIDQWDLVTFLDHVGAGEVTWSDVFARHGLNGHHIVVPRLLIAAMAFATNWSMRAETTLSWLLAGMVFVWVARLARIRGRESDNGTVAAANVLTAWLVFSLTQYWNWLWGFSLLLFLIHFFFVGALVLLARAQADSLRRRLWGAAVCCLLATFCMHHGILTWLALVPIVAGAGLTAGRLREALVSWTAAFVATLVIFVSGFPNQDSHFLAVLEMHPLRIPTYFLNLLGIPLALFAKWSFRGVLETELFWPAGAVLLACFLALSIHFLRRVDAHQRFEALPLISLGLFSVLYAAANTLGRADLADRPEVTMGIFIAIYATPPILLSVAVAQLSFLYVDRSFQAPRIRRFAISAVAAPFVLVAVLNTTAVLRVFTPLREKSRAYAESHCFEFARYLDRSNTCAYLWGDDQIAALERLGFRRFHDRLEFVAVPSPRHGRTDELVRLDDPDHAIASNVLIHGFIDLRDSEYINPREPGRRARNDLAVTGRVRFPDRPERPTTVLLTGDRRRFIAWAEVALLPEGEGESAFYAWVAPVPDILLSNAHADAWVFDPERAAVIRLPGRVTLSR